MDDFNKNKNQFHFNTIKGVLTEKNDGEVFCSLTIKVGHEKTRDVNCICKKPQFDSIKDIIQIGDKVSVQFYVTSRFKNGRWYTTASALTIEKVNLIED